MFGQNSNELPYNYPSQFQAHFEFAPQQQQPMNLAIPEEHDSIPALRSELGYTSSGCSSYGGSPTTYGSPTMLHSDVYYPFHSSPPTPLFFEPDDTSSVRNSLSTCDLQGVSMGRHSQLSNSPLATEMSIIESMNRANPYSPEEKKERIERYRNKRNLRNFNKKIKYECRKTLADSRPRIRGRFARNDEIEIKTPQSQWDPPGIQVYDEDDENWIGFLDTFSANVMP
ncbi:hypothetical protein CASFOL_030456 [Castilleja foliolosa]|uniref:CCT domain-containing protein n=1 Tax=Castilleja foliolosa TaxID=1961234 RepID=A0ABD3C8N2_9LAMI